MTSSRSSAACPAFFDSAWLLMIFGSQRWGDGRTGVTGPQPDHLVRYRDETRSGSDADDDISCEHGYGHPDDDPGPGQHGDQPPVPGRIRSCHRGSPSRRDTSRLRRRRGFARACSAYAETRCRPVPPDGPQAKRGPAVQDGPGVHAPGEHHQPGDDGQGERGGGHWFPPGGRPHGDAPGHQGAGADARGGGPLLHRSQLDGAGHHGLELLVGLAVPLQPPRVGHEHVNLALPDGLLAGGQAGVEVDAGRDVGGLCLLGDGGCQRGGGRAGDADVPGTAGLEHGGQDEHGGHADDQEEDRCLEGAGPAPLAHLPPRHQPGLPHAGHAATASRNSSDSVGGW